MFEQKKYVRSGWNGRVKKFNFLRTRTLLNALEAIIVQRQYVS